MKKYIVAKGGFVVKASVEARHGKLAVIWDKS